MFAGEVVSVGVAFSGGVVEGVASAAASSGVSATGGLEGSAFGPDACAGDFGAESRGVDSSARVTGLTVPRLPASGMDEESLVRVRSRDAFRSVETFLSDAFSVGDDAASLSEGGGGDVGSIRGATTVAAPSVIAWM